MANCTTAVNVGIPPTQAIPGASDIDKQTTVPAHKLRRLNGRYGGGIFHHSAQVAGDQIQSYSAISATGRFGRKPSVVLANQTIQKAPES